MTEFNGIVGHRCLTLAQWTSVVPLDGELCIEKPTGSSDSYRLKVGDGVAAYENLEYVSLGTTGVSSITVTGDTSARTGAVSLTTADVKAMGAITGITTPLGSKTVTSGVVTLTKSDFLPISGTEIRTVCGYSLMDMTQGTNLALTYADLGTTAQDLKTVGGISLFTSGNIGLITDSSNTNKINLGTSSTNDGVILKTINNTSLIASGSDTNLNLLTNSNLLLSTNTSTAASDSNYYSALAIQNIIANNIKPIYGYYSGTDNATLTISNAGCTSYPLLLLVTRVTTSNTKKAIMLVRFKPNPTTETGFGPIAYTFYCNGSDTPLMYSTTDINVATVSGSITYYRITITGDDSAHICNAASPATYSYVLLCSNN